MNITNSKTLKYNFKKTKQIPTKDTEYITAFLKDNEFKIDNEDFNINAFLTIELEKK